MRKYFANEISDISDHDKQQIDISYLMFKACGEIFAININDVQVIIQKPEFRKIPDMPMYIIGLTNYMRKVYPVMDVRVRFQMPHTEYSNRTPVILLNVDNMFIGLIVDDILDVIKIEAEDKLATPHEKTGFFNRFIKGFAEKNSTQIYIIDCSTLFVNEKEYFNEINGLNLEG